MSDFVQQLFPYVDSNLIRTLSCGHVIPDTNLLAWPITKGPDSVELNFTFEQRTQPKTLDSLGRTLVAIAKLIPHGLVCFFPSYGYLQQAVCSWKSGPSQIWSQLERCKEVLTDSKEASTADEMLTKYSEAVFRGNGAMLMSVVGGKMSEGINFSDELGRGVVIVGLPFPNANSIEWKTKMDHIRQRTVSQGGRQEEGSAAARALYENACMRAVNQSIGRAIRHRKDYATIFMLDKRYATPRIQSKLPGWIQKRLAVQSGSTSFNNIIHSVEKFFAQPRDT